MRKDLEKSKGSITHGLVHYCVKAFTLVVFAESILLTSRRNMRFSVSQVVGSTMVLGMSVLPRKVWNQQCLMNDEADNVIECLR